MALRETCEMRSVWKGKPKMTTRGMKGRTKMKKRIFIVWGNGELEISETISDPRIVAEAWARNFEYRFKVKHWVEER